MSPLSRIRERLRYLQLDRPGHRDDALVAWLCDVLGPWLERYFRAEIRGLERIPDGGALYVGNHSGGLTTADSYLVVSAIGRHRGMDDVPYGLGHGVIFRTPGINQVYGPLGTLWASHESAANAFEAGYKVLVYPGGDVDAFRPFRHRHRLVFDGRVGYVRLALKHGVPVVPVVCAGSHASFLVLDDLRFVARALKLDKLLRTKVFPVSLSFPWGLWLGVPPPFVPFPSRTLAEFLPPIHFDRSGDEAASDDAYVRACADRIETEMQRVLTRLAGELTRNRD